MLVVVDGPGAQWASDLVGCQVTILPLGITAEGYARANPALLQRDGVSLMDVSRVAADARRQVAEEFPRLMHAAPRQLLAGRSILDRLVTKRMSLWWLSDISEKSVFRGRLVNGCYQLAMIGQAWTRGTFDELWLAIGDGPLAAAAASCAASGIPVRRCTAMPRTPRPFEFTMALIARRAYLAMRLWAQRVMVGRMG